MDITTDRVTELSESLGELDIGVTRQLKASLRRKVVDARRLSLEEAEAYLGARLKTAAKAEGFAIERLSFEDNADTGLLTATAKCALLGKAEPAELAPAPAAEPEPAPAAIEAPPAEEAEAPKPRRTRSTKPKTA